MSPGTGANCKSPWESFGINPIGPFGQNVDVELCGSSGWTKFCPFAREALRLAPEELQKDRSFVLEAGNMEYHGIILPGTMYIILEAWNYNILGISGNMEMYSDLFTDHSGNPHYYYFPPEMGVASEILPAFFHTSSKWPCICSDRTKNGLILSIVVFSSHHVTKEQPMITHQLLPSFWHVLKFSGLGYVHPPFLILFGALSWFAGSVHQCPADADFVPRSWRGSACQGRRPSICTLRVSHGPWCGFGSGEAGPLQWAFLKQPQRWILHHFSGGSKGWCGEAGAL